ncbi:MAG: NADH-quinone oxidoreductase subunit NuoF [Actinomycetia bacterium]|nr:NADH-quinone oxidoreductase subunit NuoF [Actinomycetes bacterium]
MPLTPVITANWDDPESFKLANYERAGGYVAFKKALKTDPDDVIQTVKDSGLRGRGGAGFPTGLKWGFVPQGDDKPHYLVVNADESEPGACKDIPIMIANPHALIEGIIIATWAIRASHAFIYVRGEVPFPIRRLEAAVAEAEAAGYLGDNILGSGHNLKVVVHGGAGAYICGEETALLDSLEGKRGQPRLKPPFPAVAGLYASPTVVNNVETIASVPYILKNGVHWYREMGTEKSPGFKVWAVSGHVNNPGIYEAPLGITMGELLDYAGGMRDGRDVKFWLPGGSSVPLLLKDHLDTPMTYEALVEAGSMLGTGTPMLFDDTTSVVKAISRWLEFYRAESCGKCTPCREGTYWISGSLDQFESGAGDKQMLDGLTEISNQIFGRSFCALGDAAATPYPPAVAAFRSEFEAALTQPVDDAFDPVQTMIIPATLPTPAGAAS